MGAAPPDTSLQPPPCGSGDPSVARSLDKSAGKDGDKIHLTLTMRSNVASGTHLLVITNTLGNAQTVWPLIVVE